ncbi:MAG: helix-turn-helix domain-containing protein [Bacteroidota bacterium]
MQFGLLSVIFLFGALQALLFIISLWRRQYPRSPSFWLLVTLLIGIGIILIHHAVFPGLPATSYWKYFFIRPSSAAWMMVPPTLYLYVRSLLEEHFRWRAHFWWYYSLSFYHLMVWISALLGWHWGVYRLLFNHPEWHTYLWIGTYVLLSSGFGWATYSKLHSYINTGKKRHRLNWLYHYTIIFLGAILLAATVLLGLIATDQYGEMYEFCLLLVYELFVLILVYQSIRRSAYSGWLANRLYGSDAKPEAELRQLFNQVEYFFKHQRPYLRADLKLTDIAKACSISENELSQVFTQFLRTSYYDYVNQYRLKAFEEALQSENGQRFTIGGLATKCGFKSKTSLYRVFREKHGTTPAAYLKSQGAAISGNGKNQ